MKTHDLRFRIAQTQRAQQTALLTAILVTVFAVVTTAVAPQILYEYVLQGVSLEQQLMVLRYLPVVSYGTAVVVFLVVLVKNFMRGRSIMMYEQELQLLAYTMLDEEMEAMMPVGDTSAATTKSSARTSTSRTKKASASTTGTTKKARSTKKKSTTKKSK